MAFNRVRKRERAVTASGIQHRISPSSAECCILFLDDYFFPEVPTGKNHNTKMIGLVDPWHCS